MKEAQARAILDAIKATWPSKQMDTPTEAIWLDTIAKITTFDVARNTVAALRESSMFMPSHAEFYAVARKEAVRLAEQRALRVGEREPCAECGDLEVVALGRWTMVPTTRPCSRCRPLQYVMWSKGHYASGHSCSRCHDLHHGTATQQANAREELLATHVPVDLTEPF